MSEEKEEATELRDLLDPVQLGVIYESLMNNANEAGLNSKRAKEYIFWAEWFMQGIDANCGSAEYTKTYKGLCRRIANYDGRNP